jgi:hypothetical protein
MDSIDSFVTKNQDNLALWASFGSSILFVYHLLSDGSFSFLMARFDALTIYSAILFAYLELVSLFTHSVYFEALLRRNLHVAFFTCCAQDVITHGHF